MLTFADGVVNTENTSLRFYRTILGYRGQSRDRNMFGAYYLKNGCRYGNVRRVESNQIQLSNIDKLCLIFKVGISCVQGRE